MAKTTPAAKWRRNPRVSGQNSRNVRRMVIAGASSRPEALKGGRRPGRRPSSGVSSTPTTYDGRTSPSPTGASGGACGIPILA
ncbi:hypothetical protein GCM10027203_63340 [Nonomuraea fastidiosa]